MGNFILIKYFLPSVFCLPGYYLVFGTSTSILPGFPFIMNCYLLSSCSHYNNQSCICVFLVFTPSVDCSILFAKYLIPNYFYLFNSFKLLLLEYSCFIVLCWFLLYSKMNQSHIYIYPPPFWTFFPFKSPQCVKVCFLCYTAYPH